MKNLLLIFFLTLPFFAFSQTAINNPSEGKIITKTEFGDVTQYREHFEGCFELIEITVSEPDKYIWVSESCPACERGFICGEAVGEFLAKHKMKTYGYLHSGDCQIHCDACDCDSGQTSYVKLLKKDYEKILNTVGWPNPSRDFPEIDDIDIDQK